MKMRRERDSVGERDTCRGIFGIQTFGAVENFPVSGRRERPELIEAYVLVKKAAAITNMELGTDWLQCPAEPSIRREECI